MSNLTQAFRELRKLGYFARQNFKCCSSCAWAEVPEDKYTKAVFYHSQDAEQLRSTGICYLSWDGNAQEIIAVLKKHGIKTDHDGTNEQRIRIITVEPQ